MHFHVGRVQSPLASAAKVVADGNRIAMERSDGKELHGEPCHWREARVEGGSRHLGVRC